MMNEAEARFALGKLYAARLPKSWDGFDIKRFPVANYIIFRDDLESSLEASRDRLSSARAFLEGHGIEPLFMMDEEGGRVSQISGFFPAAPSPRAISRALTPEMAATLYDNIAANLAALGVDVNLFPCIDVNTEPMNPIIGTRSYGSTPEQVSVFVKAAVKSSIRHVACIGKHFPGHGMTRVDSHQDQPIVNDSHTRLDYMHIHPFREAIGAGLDGLMVSHCLYMNLQTDGLPASLSKQIVGEQVRHRLGYNGLVMTDSLDMKAVRDKISAPKAGLLAFEAGCDMMLYTEISERFEKSFGTLLDSILMEKVDADRLVESSRRRAEIFKRLAMLRPSPAQNADAYPLLLEKIKAKAVEVRDGGSALPIAADELALLCNSSRIVERLRARVGSLKEVREASDAAGQALVIWISEPLVVSKAFRNTNPMIENAKVSILVSTYDSLQAMLPKCDATIIYHDTSNHTEDVILKTLFGNP
jgi:beta-N-acetylhexosaminidase